MTSRIQCTRCCQSITVRVQSMVLPCPPASLQFDVVHIRSFATPGTNFYNPLSPPLPLSLSPSQVAREEMRGCVQELCPIVMVMLQDSSSLAKREVALWTFGQLVENTG